ncbi:hypothetical protein DFJ73DRAFT_778063 [Zopfochytrium polystomum]|nr:hypothetical protein DFJ73DRAFT_778063 [Zopfochytrium polystomum]
MHLPSRSRRRELHRKPAGPDGLRHDPEVSACGLRVIVATPPARACRHGGGIVVCRALFNALVFFVTDPEALRRIYVTHAYFYNWPEFIANLVKELVGESVLCAVCATHKRQRALMNP